jgi:hypothetical protein
MTMSDSLSDLSLEELWQLFPIQLVAPNQNGKLGMQKKNGV